MANSRSILVVPDWDRLKKYLFIRHKQISDEQNRICLLTGCFGGHFLVWLLGTPVKCWTAAARGDSIPLPSALTVQPFLKPANQICMLSHGTRIFDVP